MSDEVQSALWLILGHSMTVIDLVFWWTGISFWAVLLFGFVVVIMDRVTRAFLTFLEDWWVNR